MSTTPELDRWNQRFAGESYLFGKAPNAFLASQKHRLRPGMTALAIADGEGRNGVWLAEQGLQVTGFDFAPNGMAKARQLARERGVHVDLLTVERLASRLEELVPGDEPRTHQVSGLQRRVELVLRVAGATTEAGLLSLRSLALPSLACVFTSS